VDPEPVWRLRTLCGPRTGLVAEEAVWTQNRSERCREEKNLLHLLGIEPRFLGTPANSPSAQDTLMRMAL
jgi:hypothetical protein